MANTAGTGKPDVLGTRGRAWLAALPDFGLAAMFLVIWIAPAFAGLRGLHHIGNLLVMEFLSIHLSAVLGWVFLSKLPRRRKTIGIVGVGAIYSTIFASVSVVLHSIWPLVGLWLLILNRIGQVLFGKLPSERERSALAVTWAWSALSFVLLGLLTTFVPVPRLGITEALRAAPGHDVPLWQLDPERMLLFGLLYFAAIGIAELRIPDWIVRLRLRPRG